MIRGRVEKGGGEGVEGAISEDEPQYIQIGAVAAMLRMMVSAYIFEVLIPEGEGGQS